MKIHALSASNFMSFQTLNFSVPDTGLHFVGGEVRGQSVFNSNGAGKSALFEALCFGLYGKTIRNAGKDDIINRKTGKDCVVAVELESDGHEYSVFRFRGDSDNANELRLMKGEQDITAGNMNATQDMLNQILGMNWLVFSNAVVFGEKARRFTQAKDSEKKEIFDEILMLHQYQLAQHAVKGDVKALQTNLDKHKQDVDLILVSLGQYKDSYTEEEGRLAEAKEKSKEFDAQIEALIAEIKEAEEGVEGAEKELLVLEKDKQTMIEGNDELYKAVTELTEEKNVQVSEARGIEDQARVELRHYSGKYSEVTGFLEGKALPVGQRCPKCKHLITEESEEDVRKHFMEEKRLLKTKMDEFRPVVEEAEEHRRSTEEEFDKKIEEATALRHDYDIQMVKMEDRLAGARGYTQQANSLIASKKQSISVLQESATKDTKSIEVRMEDILKKMEPLQEKLLGSEKSILEIEGEMEYHTFWIEGFGNKGIKSFLLDEVVPDLNSKANYYASMLMDDDVIVEFKTESTLKSGESRDKFNVKILFGGQGRIEPEEVAYENCSSGEKGRIDVAILLSLQNLIFSRSANSGNLVIFDEVFEHLDITGIERVVNLLKEEAQSKAILVISHQNELKDYFDNQILVVKDTHGVSRIEA